MAKWRAVRCPGSKVTSNSSAGSFSAVGVGGLTGGVTWVGAAFPGGGRIGGVAVNAMARWCHTYTHTHTSPYLVGCCEVVAAYS